MADRQEFRGRVDFESATNLNGTTKCSGANSKFNYISDPVVAPAETTTTLTTSQSGAAVLLTPNAGNVVLPSASPAGQRFEFVMAGNYASADCTVTTAAGNFIGGIATGNSAHKEQAPSPANTATFGTAANAGDRFECVSDGTNWYIVNGYCEDDDGLVFSNV